MGGERLTVNSRLREAIELSVDVTMGVNPTKISRAAVVVGIRGRHVSSPPAVDTQRHHYRRDSHQAPEILSDTVGALLPDPDL
ncbi:MAG: hypothetical protein EMLJLAPB_00467 [Candidatus Argoarchaeum ethanivorans]|uniref:Uncharacterized protein n=1 Tax=Candidatus Argoarchaeum ethanivorans TaxID=2608793 RepID=A0A811TFA4_9EURY|nr:MAG: hypothetical protein EMLJLAPB_00467 [Candidatus Argoarchaeum ethanivorans]